MANPGRNLDAFRRYPELAATAGHIVNVQNKLDRLGDVKRDSWAQLLAAVHRLFEVCLSEEDLMDFLDEMGASYGVGYTRFWDAHMPKHLSYVRVRSEAQRIRYWREEYDRNRPNGPASNTWAGTWPVTRDQPTPRAFLPVVYVLFDGANEPAYVGSTEDFRTRMKVHQREKPGLARWMAYRCADREGAYVLEDKLLKEHKPRMNKKRGR